ncbi:hypothetical protein R7Q39_14985 [Vibrio sp. 947]|nr:MULTISPECIES: hypothetical protein [Vibrio]MDW1926727.1 hypothetical protein [Vibrio sp. 947]MCA2418851.1 hypothetical protein [Vibrio alginolyticus]MCA2443477.1 hypothetical protein [Vibrio alginolyticus]MDW1948092.1 hypothetical protein [Vibrio sp. 812(2023)]MDW1990893.1 hypothetical protein [Vibrio sp. 780]
MASIGMPSFDRLAKFRRMSELFVRVGFCSPKIDPKLQRSRTLNTDSWFSLYFNTAQNDDVPVPIT